jgi:hypothetical protein
MRNMFFFLKKSILKNVLRFDRMHKNKIFLIILKEKINLKILEIFFNLQIFLRSISEKTRFFNIESISYSVNIQPDILQN